MAKKLYGTDPDQVPTNADLGTMAYQDAENPRLNNVVISGQPDDSTDGTLLRIKRGPSESGTWATVAIEAQTANGNSRIAFVNDIEPSAADAHGMIDFEHQTNQMQFFVDGSEAAHFNASGNLVFPNGQGIDFSASEGSGASSSVLDDYEEGDFTVTDRSGGGLSITVVDSGYTKIGRVVHAYYQVTYPTNSSSSAARLSLPFPSALGGSYTGGAVLETNYSGGAIMASCDASTYVRFRLNGYTPMTNANLSGKNLRFTIHYITNS